jgi:cob(I)alamin adenosyltransferase
MGSDTMSYRLTKIYTKQGDTGYTTLGDKPIPKDDILVEAVGTIDELNAQIGMVIALNPPRTDIKSTLTQVQNDLLDLGGELHLPQYPAITEDKVRFLEIQLDEWNNTLAPLKEFILPGGDILTASAHIARTVCRRAERCLVKLHRQVPLTNPCLIKYLNRLSDLLFVCARILAKESQSEERMWEHERE